MTIPNDTIKFTDDQKFNANGTVTHYFISNASRNELRLELKTNDIYADKYSVKLNGSKVVLAQEFIRLNELFEQQETKTEAIAEPEVIEVNELTDVEIKAVVKAMKNIIGISSTEIKEIKSLNNDFNEYQVELKNGETINVTKEEIIENLGENEVKKIDEEPTFKTNRATKHQHSEIFKAEEIKAIYPNTNNAKVITYMFENGYVTRNDFEKVGVPSKKQISQCIAIISRKGYGIKSQGKKFMLILPDGMTEPYIKSTI